MVPANEESLGGAGLGPNHDGPGASPIRLSYRQIERYDPGRAPCRIDLSDNTNLFGAPPSVRDTLREASPDEIVRYGSVYAEGLKSVLASRFGLAPDQIATGCGSDDLIDSAIRVFCPPGQVVAFPDPSFSMLPDFARMNGARPVAVPLGPEFELRPEAMKETRARLVYLCNPNNPTGTGIDDDAIERVSADLEGRGVLLIDEAYAEYSGRSSICWAASSPNAIVLRTFSKACGLAGLRVGYAVGPRHLIAALEKSRGPFKVGALAETVATRVLEQDEEWVQTTVERTRTNRERLSAELAEMGLRYWPSAANFLLVSAPGGNAQAFKEALRDFDVGVRAFPAIPQAGDCVRITIGPWALMECLLSAIKESMKDARFSV
jgi:histidinol-phosphate aminotransferase